MSTKNAGGPAFPRAETWDHERGKFVPHASPGMTLRDWFAGQIAASLAQHINANSEGYVANLKTTARVAYDLAAVLLDERNSR